MGKTGIKASGETDHSFKVKSYSVAEIFAAGGATAFATKMGQNPEDFFTGLKDFPKEDFLTDEEAEIALEMLRNNK